MQTLTNDPGPLTRRAALRALAMAALCAAPLPLTRAHAAPAPRSHPRRQNGGTLRTLTLNVWGLPSAPDREFRMAHTADALAEGDYDLVAIQEAWLGLDRDTLRAGAARGGLEHDVFFDEGSFGTGLMLFSRYPLADAAFSRYTLNGDPFVADFYVPKGVGYARTETPSGPLDVYVTHTIAQNAYSAHRIAQFFEFAEQFNARSADMPAIALGDFNIRPNRFGFAMLLALTGMVDGLTTLHPDDPGYTYSSENPYKPETSSRRLDYVLARSGGALRLTPEAAEVALKLIPMTEGTPQPKAYSDHYGLHVDYALEPLATPLPSPVPTGDKVENTLREAAAVLREGLAEEESRRPRRAVGAGVGLAGAAALYTAGTRIEPTNEELGGIIKGPSAAAAGVYALASGWLAAITSGRIVRGYEAVLRRIDARLSAI